MSDTKPPAPAPRRCPGCGCALGDIHRKGCRFLPPAPAPSGVLSAEGVKDLLSCLQISMLYTGKKHVQNREDSRAKLLAHDAALRAEVERLTKESALHYDTAQTLLTQNARLLKALREIAEERQGVGPHRHCSHCAALADIAAAALAAEKGSV